MLALYGLCLRSIDPLLPPHTPTCLYHPHWLLSALCCFRSRRSSRPCPVAILLLTALQTTELVFFFSTHSLFHIIYFLFIRGYFIMPFNILYRVCVSASECVHGCMSLNICTVGFGRVLIVAMVHLCRGRRLLLQSCSALVLRHQHWLPPLRSQQHSAHTGS